MTGLNDEDEMLSFEVAKARRPSSADGLRRSLRALYGGESIVVLANREPFRHERRSDGGIDIRRSSGGLVTALEPVIRACCGTWVAHGSGSADRVVVDERDGVAMPPANPQYRLRRVWLDPEEERGYYYGFANEGLWPLCHRTRVAPVFRSADFSMYGAVNARFAAAVFDEIDSARPLVLVQDYHFALAPRMIQQRAPLSTIVAFWHIPWPTPAALGSCPWARHLVHGLLGSTIAGFQTRHDCRNFLDAAETLLGAAVDRSRGTAAYRGHVTAVRAYPVSIEWPNRCVAESPPVDVCRMLVRQALGLSPDTRLAVGIDRLDYTKGIEEKLRAVARLLDCCPDYRARFVFVQVAESSRDCLPAYRDLRARLRGAASEINARFGTSDHRPVILLEARDEPAAVYRLLRAADVCYVGSLHDGMNLVAKEFVAARDDERGVLVLSRFTGAAQELTPALIVDPYVVEECAGALRTALAMPVEEQRIRMRAMRTVVGGWNAYTWASSLLADAAHLRARPAVVPVGETHRQAVGLPA